MGCRPWVTESDTTEQLNNDIQIWEITEVTLHMLFPLPEMPFPTLTAQVDSFSTHALGL